MMGNCVTMEMAFTVRSGKLRNVYGNMEDRFKGLHLWIIYRKSKLPIGNIVWNYSFEIAMETGLIIFLFLNISALCPPQPLKGIRQGANDFIGFWR